MFDDISKEVILNLVKYVTNRDTHITNDDCYLVKIKNTNLNHIALLSINLLWLKSVQPQINKLAHLLI